MPDDDAGPVTDTAVLEYAFAEAMYGAEKE